MQLEVGSVVDGKITGITKFGAFVGLPEGKSGMVHISEVASEYVKEIRDFVTEGQEVKVKILSIGEDGKINLSIKRAAETPRSAAPMRRPEGMSPGQSGRQFRDQSGSRNNFDDMVSSFLKSSDEKSPSAKKGGGDRRSSRKSYDRDDYDYD